MKDTLDKLEELKKLNDEKHVSDHLDNLFNDLKNQDDKKITMSIYLPKKICDKLLALANKYDTSKNEIILRILKDYLKED